MSLLRTRASEDNAVVFFDDSKLVRGLSPNRITGLSSKFAGQSIKFGRSHNDEVLQSSEACMSRSTSLEDFDDFGGGDEGEGEGEEGSIRPERTLRPHPSSTYSTSSAVSSSLRSGGLVVDIMLVKYKQEQCIEVISYCPLTGRTAPRLYVDSCALDGLLDHHSFEDRLATTRSNALRQHLSLSDNALVEHVFHDMYVSFLLPRLQLAEGCNLDEEFRIVVVRLEPHLVLPRPPINIAPIELDLKQKAE